MERQLTLDLSFRPALGRDDFLVADSNSQAVALIDQWPQWPSYGAIITGPPGSGKSHLAMVWQQKASAAIIAARDLKLENLPHLLHSNRLVIEDIDSDKLPERALFHALNLARQQSGHILMTACLLPTIKLSDLASRLHALPHSLIKSPGDALLRGVLVKHFSDRQIAVDEGLVSYMLTRMPRSLEAARRLVAEVDRQSLEQGAEVTRLFVGRVLSQFENPELL